MNYEKCGEKLFNCINNIHSSPSQKATWRNGLLSLSLIPLLAVTFHSASVDIQALDARRPPSNKIWKAKNIKNTSPSASNELEQLHWSIAGALRILFFRNDYKQTSTIDTILRYSLRFHSLLFHSPACGLHARLVSLSKPEKFLMSSIAARKMRLLGWH